MQLLPTQQTAAQLAALRKFLDNGSLTMREPCDCGGQIRHNNGGNYHAINDYRADGGRWFARLGSTSEYDDSEWEEIDFVHLLDCIQRDAAAGFRS